MIIVFHRNITTLIGRVGMPQVKYSKVPLLRPPMGPTQSGLNSESVLIMNPYGMIYTVCDKTCSSTW